MSHLTEADLDAIRQRVEAATPGPWGRGSSRTICQADSSGKPLERTGQRPAGDSFPLIGQCMHYDDLDFLIHARTDIPQLLAAIDERDKVIHDMMEESDARRLAQRYRDVIKAVKYLIRGWRGESSIAERIVFKLIDEALEDNP